MRYRLLSLSLAVVGISAAQTFPQREVTVTHMGNTASVQFVVSILDGVRVVYTSPNLDLNRNGSLSMSRSVSIPSTLLTVGATYTLRLHLNNTGIAIPPLQPIVNASYILTTSSNLQLPGNVASLKGALIANNAVPFRSTVDTPITVLPDIPIPPFSQGDPLWGTDNYALHPVSDNYRMDNYGCATTNVAIMLGAVGFAQLHDSETRIVRRHGTHELFGNSHLDHE